MGGFTGPATRLLGGKKVISRAAAEVIAPSGNQVIFQVVQAPNSSGPYDQTVASSMILGATIPPIPSPTGIAPLGTFTPSPVMVNGLPLEVVGAVGDGPIWYWTVCLLGVVPQNHFTDMTFQTVSDGPVTLTSAAADFNGLFTGVGYSIWVWPMPFTGLPQDLLADNSDIIITWP